MKTATQMRIAPNKLITVSKAFIINININNLKNNKNSFHNNLRNILNKTPYNKKKFKANLHKYRSKVRVIKTILNITNKVK